ncbi:MAG: DUF2948 family protein [Rhodobacteraceae bacterium]|nr:DUF2948 family protein [Paracoccaceae bacterium]MCY4250560.1 DUF2948 family protein [Paracoccaceae bacterium]
MNKTDAQYEDTFGDEPLKVRAEDQEDLTVLSSYLQDAIFLKQDISHDKAKRELAILLNRVRWELIKDEGKFREPVERVRSLLIIKDVLEMNHFLPDAKGSDIPLSLLALQFKPGEDGTGTISCRLSGHWDIHASVECINAYLTDVTKPYLATSRKLPSHPE